MARPRTPSARTTPDPDLARLPKALRDRAQKLSDEAAKRRVNAAREAFERAKAALGETHRHLYELGVALAALKTPGAAASLGYADFTDLHTRGLGVSRATVSRLLRAIEVLPRERYVALGAQRVNALLELADATEDDDTAAILDGRVVSLWPKGPTLDVAKSDAAEILEAAKEVRARRSDEGRGTGRGRTVSPAERRLAKQTTEALAGAGSAAKLVAKATVPGRPARFELVGLTEDEARRAAQGLGVKLPRR